jgi:hypothetical protein
MRPTNIWPMTSYKEAPCTVSFVAMHEGTPLGSFSVVLGPSFTGHSGHKQCDMTSVDKSLLLRFLKDARTGAIFLRQGAEFTKQYQLLFHQARPTSLSSLHENPHNFEDLHLLRGGSCPNPPCLLVKRRSGAQQTTCLAMRSTTTASVGPCSSKTSARLCPTLGFW